MMNDVFLIFCFLFFMKTLITLIHPLVHSLCLPLLSLTRSVFYQMSISGPPQFFPCIEKSVASIIGSLSSLIIRVTGGRKTRPIDYFHLKDRENVQCKINHILNLIS